MSGERVEFDLRDRTEEERGMLDYLLEQHDVDRRWSGGVLSVPTASRAEVERALAYLESEPPEVPLPHWDEPPGDRESSDAAAVPIVSRTEAWVAIGATTVWVVGAVTWLTLTIAGNKTDSTGLLMLRAVALVAAIGGSWFGLAVLRSLRGKRPGREGPDAALRRWWSTRGEPNLLRSSIAAIRYLRRARRSSNNARVGPRSAPPPPG